MCYKSILVISVFFWFMKLSHLHGEYVSMLSFIHHASDLSWLTFFNPLTTKVPNYIETSQLNCYTNQPTWRANQNETDLCSFPKT